MKKVDSTTKNTAKNKNTITFNKWKGVVNGNIFEPAGYGCEIKLDFSCEDNSQYIAAI
jgi:hypothetical protein